jgi:hypothetical protein
MDLVGNIRGSFYSKVSQYLSRAALVEGDLKNTGSSFRCLFVGHSRFANYLMQKMYAQPPHVLQRRIIWIPALKKIIKKSHNDFDMCVAVLPSRYEKTFEGLYEFKSQRYVRQIIDTSGSWEEIIQRFNKRKRQYTNNLPSKYNLWFRISHDLNDFDFFYHQMHITHIKKKYRDLSDIDSYDDMKAYFLKGFLLFVTKGDQTVAGALCLIQGRTLIYRRSGFLAEDEHQFKDNIQTILYYFVLLFAKNKNLAKVDTMKSSSFLNDGVYRHKREWGAVVHQDDESDSWVYFFPRKHSVNVVDFFKHNPLIIFTDSGLCSLLGWDNTMEFSSGNKEELIKRYYSPGIDKIMLLTADMENLKTIDFKKDVANCEHR